MVSTEILKLQESIEGNVIPRYAHVLRIVLGRNFPLLILVPYSQFLGLCLRMNCIPLPKKKLLTTQKACLELFLVISGSLETSVLSVD